MIAIHEIMTVCYMIAFYKTLGIGVVVRVREVLTIGAKGC